MDRLDIRRLKSHYLSRWAVFKHNRKHQDKILLLADKFVLANLTAGPTLCHQCLGSIYNTIIPDLDVVASPARYQNLVMINNLCFKYKTLPAICDHVIQLANSYINQRGRLIFSFQHQTLVYDRMAISINQIPQQVQTLMNSWQLIAKSNLWGRSPPGYGDFFFCFQRQ